MNDQAVDVVSINQVTRGMRQAKAAECGIHGCDCKTLWHDLKPIQRERESRIVRAVIEELQRRGVKIKFVDEYAPIDINDARWQDPETLPGVGVIVGKVVPLGRHSEPVNGEDRQAAACATDPRRRDLQNV